MNEGRPVSREEYEAEFDRSKKAVDAILDKAMDEMEAQKLETGAVITALLRLAGDVAMSSGMQDAFAQAVGAAITLVANQGKMVDGGDLGRNGGMIQGLKLTARMNAGANGIPVHGMIPLLLHAAVELSSEEGCLGSFIDLIAGMGKLAEKMKARDGNEPTKH